MVDKNLKSDYNQFERFFTAGNGGFWTRYAMVNWHRFIPTDFEYDFKKDKLAAHNVTFEEAVECFFSDFQVRRNKNHTEIGINSLEKPLMDDDSRSFFNSSRTTLFASLRGGKYEIKKSRKSLRRTN